MPNRTSAENDPNAMRLLCEEFASENLAECCQDMLAMHTDGHLTGGAFRELQAMCNQWSPGYGMSVAESLIKRKAMEFVVKQAHNQEQRPPAQR